MCTCKSTWFTKERRRMKHSLQQLSGIFIPVLNNLMNYNNVQTLWLYIWLPATAFNDAFNEQILVSAWCVSWSGSASIPICVEILYYWHLLRTAEHLSKYSMWPTLAFAACGWLLGTLRRALATDFAVCVHSREWRRPFWGVTSSLHFYTLQDLVQDITCRKQRVKVRS